MSHTLLERIARSLDRLTSEVSEIKERMKPKDNTPSPDGLWHFKTTFVNEKGEEVKPQPEHAKVGNVIKINGGYSIEFVPKHQVLQKENGTIIIGNLTPFPESKWLVMEANHKEPYADELKVKSVNEGKSIADMYDEIYSYYPQTVSEYTVISHADPSTVNEDEEEMMEKREYTTSELVEMLKWRANVNTFHAANVLGGETAKVTYWDGGLNDRMMVSFYGPATILIVKEDVE